jgi:hypothetical protein
MIYNSGWHDKPTATRETGRRLRRRAPWPVAQGLLRHFSAFDTQIHAVRRPLPSTAPPMVAGSIWVHDPFNAIGMPWRLS